MSLVGSAHGIMALPSDIFMHSDFWIASSSILIIMEVKIERGSDAEFAKAIINRPRRLRIYLTYKSMNSMGICLFFMMVISLTLGM